MRRLFAFVVAVFLASAAFAALTPEQSNWVKQAERVDRDGWIYLYANGGPTQRGFQNGYLLANDIRESIKAIKHYMEYTTQKDWKFFRAEVEKVFWPNIFPEYQEELKGIEAGLKAAGVTEYDYIDLTVFNSFMDIAWYYLPWLGQQQTGQGAHGSCSAFIATGNATRDGRIVVAHNLWYEYMFCNRWNVILDMNPDKGYRFVTQAFPGWIFGGTDFWINAAGLIVTETTISTFTGFDPKGVPEPARIRKALQYGASIDEFVGIMVERNSGAYANDWLVGDIKTGEIARLELGLKHQKVWRTFDGYYTGSNIAQDMAVRKDETSMDYGKMDSSPVGRWARWQQLLRDNYGKIDVDWAKKAEADHYDTFHEKYNLSSRTICGHVENDPLGLPEWGWGPYYPGGAIDAKVTDSDLAYTMSFHAKFGHSCEVPFLVEPFLQAHPEYKWQLPFLKDFPSFPWTRFTAKGFRK